jgi:hypothetical protein
VLVYAKVRTFAVGGRERRGSGAREADVSSGATSTRSLAKHCVSVTYTGLNIRFLHLFAIVVSDETRCYNANATFMFAVYSFMSRINIAFI